MEVFVDCYQSPILVEKMTHNCLGLWRFSVFGFVLFWVGVVNAMILHYAKLAKKNSQLSFLSSKILLQVNN